MSITWNCVPPFIITKQLVDIIRSRSYIFCIYQWANHTNNSLRSFPFIKFPQPHSLISKETGSSCNQAGQCKQKRWLHACQCEATNQSHASKDHATSKLFHVMQHMVKILWQGSAIVTKPMHLFSKMLYFPNSCAGIPVI
jgi:hypothetical protein